MLVISIAFAFCLQAASSDKVDHAIYLSVAEITQNEKKDEVSIRVKVFINDIEDAVLNETHQRINLPDSSAFNSQKVFLEAYFKDHLVLTLNDKAVQLELAGHELNGDAIWLKFTAKCESKWKAISVKADYLMELFPTQSNVISIVYDNKKHFARLTNSKSREEIKF